MIEDTSDFIGKYIQVITKIEAEIEGTLLAIETNGILLKDIDEDKKEFFYFIPSNSIDHLCFDPEGNY